MAAALFAGCGGGGSPVAVMPPSDDLSFAADARTADAEEYDPDTDARMAECHTKTIKLNPMFEKIYNDIKTGLQQAPDSIFSGPHSDKQKQKTLRSLENVYTAFYGGNQKHAVKILKSKNFRITAKCSASCSKNILILDAKIDFLIKFINHNGFKTLTAAATPASLYPNETSVLSAALTYNDNKTENVTKYITWTVAPAQTGSVAASIFTAAAPGEAKVVANLFGWLQSEPVTITVNQPVSTTPDEPPTPQEPPTTEEPPTPPVTPDPVIDPSSPFTCGNATSLAPVNPNWGVFPDSIVAYDNNPGDGINWGYPTVYIEYDYFMNYTSYMIASSANPTGCMLAEGNPGSMLTENIVIITTPEVTVRAYFPDLTTRATNSNMGVYVAADGSTYWARSDNYATSKLNSAPDLTALQAIRPEHLARKAQ